jgi:hypothetical protein
MNTKRLKSMLVIAAMGIAGSAYATSLTLDNPPGLVLSPGDTVGISNFLPYNLIGSNSFTDNWDFQLASTSGVGDAIFNLVATPQSNISGLTANLYAVTGGVLGPVLATGTNFSLPSLAVLPSGDYYDLVMKGTVTGSVGGGHGGTLSVASPVPPAAAWLLLSGLAGVGAMARRRKIEAIDA